MELLSRAVAELGDLADGYRSWPAGGGEAHWNGWAAILADSGIDTPLDLLEWLSDPYRSSNGWPAVSEELFLEIATAAGITGIPRIWWGKRALMGLHHGLKGWRNVADPAKVRDLLVRQIGGLRTMARPEWSEFQRELVPLEAALVEMDAQELCAGRSV